MNGFTKILFWTLTIILGFVNPVISVIMVVLYYLPKIIATLFLLHSGHDGLISVNV